MKFDEMFDNALNAQCEQNYNNWRDVMMSASANSGGVNAKLEAKLDAFIKDNKHEFYRDYKNKLALLAKQHIEKALSSSLRAEYATPLEQEAEKVIVSKTDLNLLPATTHNVTFEERKNREFLEAYVSCHCNQRAAAKLLGVPKSTFCDWVGKHRELIDAEFMKGQ